MLPTLRDGDVLLACSPHLLSPAPGRIVVFRDPRDRRRRSIKRVAVREQGGWFVLGDHTSRSTDSRMFGAVPGESIQAVVLCCCAPLPRTAWLIS